VAERTRAINRLRWHLHEIDPEIDPTPRSLDRTSNYTKLESRIACYDGLVPRLARREIERCRGLTADINEIEGEIVAMVARQAPTLLAVVGVGALTAAKIVGETAGISRFKSSAAFARHNGTAPLPVWSSNHERHRLSRVGNRQLNAALHRIALTQVHWHPPAKELYARRRANGDGGMEALRVLKRRLSDVVYRALITDAATTIPLAA
jgi:transposase